MAVPVPVGIGRPGRGYPFEWSIWEWLEGEPASGDTIADLPSFAEELATFLLALSRCDVKGGPHPEADNFFRAGNLDVYDEQVQACPSSLISSSRRIASSQTLGTSEEDGGTASPVATGGKINQVMIERNWPNILHTAATIAAGSIAPSQVLRKPASYPRQNELATTLRKWAASRELYA